MIPRLGVNVDHVATLRQQRDEGYPSVIDASSMSLRAGADQITIHLREDRRHIQDTDVQSVHLVTKDSGKLLNLEMGCSEEISEIAVASRPEWICLVPEKREEKTTEGGLDLVSDSGYKKVSEMVELLKSQMPNVKISLFVEASEEVMKKSISLGVDAVEIHTGHYARAFMENECLDEYFESFKRCHDIINESSLTYHAGHGLTLDSVIPLLKLQIFEEYNIGHWIIAQAIFDGLSNVVDRFIQLFKQYPLNK